jgi:cytochrome c biogenesis protein CcdA
MNVLDFDVYMDVLYIVYANYAGFVIPVVLVILFSTKKFKAQTNLRWLRIVRHRLASIINVGRASHRRLS